MGKPNRVEVVAKLSALFEKLGYTGAGMNEISAAIGLGRGSLYHLFPDGKAQMMRESLAALQDEFSQSVVVPLQGDGDVTAMFENLLHFYREGERGSIWGRLILDPQGEQFKAEIQEHFNEWRGALTKALLDAGIERGRAASLSERTLSGVEGTLVLAAGFEDSGALLRGLRTMNSQLSEVISQS